MYLDASALVKRYVAETGSAQVEALIGEARAPAPPCRAALKCPWRSPIRLQFGEPLAALAGALAWEHGVRGYDAVHLAAALVWRETLGEMVTVATYDRERWRGAKASGLSAWPVAMP